LYNDKAGQAKPAQKLPVSSNVHCFESYDLPDNIKELLLNAARSLMPRDIAGSPGLLILGMMNWFEEKSTRPLME